MAEDTWEAELAEGRAWLRDAGAVLGTRRQLDGLALDVLAAPGLAEEQVDRFQVFLQGQWPRGVAAAARLRAATGADGTPR